MHRILNCPSALTRSCISISFSPHFLVHRSPTRVAYIAYPRTGGVCGKLGSVSRLSSLAAATAASTSALNVPMPGGVVPMAAVDSDEGGVGGAVKGGDGGAGGSQSTRCIRPAWPSCEMGCGGSRHHTAPGCSPLISQTVATPIVDSEMVIEGVRDRSQGEPGGVGGRVCGRLLQQVEVVVGCGGRHHTGYTPCSVIKEVIGTDTMPGRLARTQSESSSGLGGSET